MILQWKPFQIHLPSFNQFLIDNCPSTDGINASHENFTIVLRENIEELPQIEVDAIQNYYDSLTEEVESQKFLPTQEQIISQKVDAAIDFGKLLMDGFIKENVLLGITELGLTNHVRKTLREVKDAMETGSLYDSITEIRLIDQLALDDTILTESRLLDFRHKIESFLKIPMSGHYQDIETWL